MTPRTCTEVVTAVATSVLVALAAPALAGAPSSVPAARSAFAATADPCAVHVEEQAAIFADLFAGGEPALDEWAAALEEYLPMARETAHCVAELEPPAKLARAFEDFNAALGAYLALQEQSLVAAVEGDRETFEALGDEAQGSVKRQLIRAANLLGIGAWFE